MYKKVCCTCKVAFLLIRPIVVFHPSPALPSPLSITRFYILFEQTLDVIGALLLPLAKSIITSLLQYSGTPFYGHPLNTVARIYICNGQFCCHN